MKKKQQSEVEVEGPGFRRMKARLGPERMEELRQQTLREQREALASTPERGAEQDRADYRGYPAPKSAKRAQSKRVPEPEAKPATWVKDKAGEFRDLGHGLILRVSYEAVERLSKGAPGYNVSVFGRKLFTRSKTLEGGKARAEAAARSWLNEALVKL